MEQVGFRYGSLVEDYYTGLVLHCQRWRSVLCNPRRAAFLGHAPTTLNDSLSQVRRWVVGLLEVAISRHCPLILGFKNSMFLVGMCYAHYAFWPFWCIPILIYGTFPQIALLYGHQLLPKASDPRSMVYVYLFMAAYAKDLVDHLIAGGTYRRWWNSQRMWLIRGVTAFPMGSLEYVLKHFGFPGLGFNVTCKMADPNQSTRYQEGLFELIPTSPFTISIGTIAIINLVALVVGLTRDASSPGDVMVQLMLCGFVVVNCLPIYEAMFIRRDGGRMEADCVVKCCLLAAILCALGGFVLS